MNKQPNPELIDDDNPEWTEDMFARARFGTAAAKRGRPLGSNKVSTTIRFDQDVLEAFRDAGPGWQSRMNDALRDWLKQHPQQRSAS